MKKRLTLLAIALNIILCACGQEVSQEEYKSETEKYVSESELETEKAEETSTKETENNMEEYGQDDVVYQDEDVIKEKEYDVCGDKYQISMHSDGVDVQLFMYCQSENVNSLLLAQILLKTLGGSDELEGITVVYHVSNNEVGTLISMPAKSYTYCSDIESNTISEEQWIMSIMSSENYNVDYDSETYTDEFTKMLFDFLEL